jgi:hypothetical protein
MKKFALLILLMFAVFKLSAFIMPDSVAQKTSGKPMVDSLKQQLTQAPNDSVKAGLYKQIAEQYLNYDTLSDKKDRQYYQNEALSYTFMAIRSFSRYNDTVSLRDCFNDLTKVYISQKKYSQAKWYILQSNTISRNMNDVPNIISSLIVLAGIKMDINDNSLARSDLDESLHLAMLNHLPLEQASVQKTYATLYKQLKDPAREAVALKRYRTIMDSLHLAEQRQLIAKNNAGNITQSKKKLRLASYRHSYKAGSARRIASI